MSDYNFSQEEWNICVKVLMELKDAPLQNPDNKLFSGLISKIYKNAKRSLRQNTKNLNRDEDIKTLTSSVIAENALNNRTLYSEGERVVDDEYSELRKLRHCYSCNNYYLKMHFFYSRLCPDCATSNYSRRFESSNLSNKNVIITGGRVKVGYATALKLLRANAKVLVTTRFPALAHELFMKEKDHFKWKENLTVYGLDLRNLQAVEEFIAYYKSNFDGLDILINNAAQTIKYPNSYYLPIVQKEVKLIMASANSKEIIENKTSVLDDHRLLNSKTEFNDFAINRFGQPVDDRMKTSWNSTLEEISMYELLEVNLINQISPYFLIKELTTEFKKSKSESKFIINVTSSEGQFSYNNKTIFHPHTNMTKAALNMLTRTSAKEYEKDNILMYAVDVGWISTGAKEPLRQKQFEKGYIPPLDSVDGAARITHPINEALNGNAIPVGTLLKNYKVEQW